MIHPRLCIAAAYPFIATSLSPRVLRLIIICFLGLYLSAPLKADHWWYVNSLTIVEDPANSDIYRIDYSYTVNFQTVERFYWELFVVESGCNASDGFTANFSGCTIQGNLRDGDYTGTLASGIRLCPGKSYDAIMYTRRRGDCTGDSTGGSGGPNPSSCNSAAPTNCGDDSCGCPEDRADVATPLGLLTKFPAIDTVNGDPSNIWSGSPLNTLGDTPTYDGNWAYIRTTLSGNGVPDYDFMVDIDIDDCFGVFDKSFMADETDGQVVFEDFGGEVATVRCGATVMVTYNASNNCGEGYPGNTFEVLDSSTIGGANIGSANTNVSGQNENVDGRFENFMGAIAIGNLCNDGTIDLTLINATCSSEEETFVKVKYDIEVMYPTSNFNTPTRVNCSDVCGQELVISGGAQWNPDGINMGTATTMPVTDDPDGLFSFDWTGQVCEVSTSADACNSGQGSAKADNCASCGIYDIQYAITNDSCGTCDATTTKQIEIISAVITNVQSDITEGCSELSPTLTFDVMECDPANPGTATSTPYTGVGDKMWERSDMPGVFLPYNSPGTVPPGETITFTPHWRYDGCQSCNAVGTPITVVSIGELVVSCPMDNDLGDFDCTNLVSIPAPPTSQATAEADPYNITFGDDPCGDIVVTSIDDATPDACTAVDQMITRTVTILDDQDGSGSQNGDEQQQECVFTYTIKPVFVSPTFMGLPSNITIDCEMEPTPTTLTYSNGLTADCASSGSATSVLSSYPGICGGMMTETWTIPSSDNCGRGDIVETRTITITPPDPPTISCPSDQIVDCAANIMAGMTMMTTSCGATTSVSESAALLVSGDADCPGASYQITYTVTDQCGQTASCTQTFTIANDPPTISCPANETVACVADITINPMDATVTTSCNLGKTTSTVGPTLVSGTADCPGAIYEVVYTTMDDCGRSASCTQSFTIANDAPTITCPANETVECANDISIGMPAITSACTLGASVSTSGPTLASGDADCPGATYEVEYTVQDDCGRQASCVQTFTIANDAPTIMAPADATIDCAEKITAGTATVESSCTLGTSVSSSAPVLVSGDADCPGAVYQITYTVEDDCGRTASAIQDITIDNAAPTITCPADKTVACSADITTGGESFTTSCSLGGSVSVSGPTLASGDADCPRATYEVIYTVEDDCGRTAQCTQVFTIDNAAPTITCPGDMTVECATDIVPGMATMVTSCSLGSSITNTMPALISGDANCPGARYEVVYTGQDDCGRTATCSQIFTIDNAQAPLMCAAQETVECADDIMPVAPTFSSICGIATDPIMTVGPTLISGSADCDGAIYQVVFSTTDACGRSLSCSQNFVISNAPPMITSCPADQTVTCSDDIVADEMAVTFTTSCMLDATATAGPTIADSANSTCGDATGDLYTITYTVEDDCGRTATCTQTFTVSPLPPEIICPTDMILTGCTEADAPAVDTTSVMGSDGCGVITRSHIGDTMTGSGCPGDTLIITRTYQVTNDCGVSVQCDQLIKIIDDEAPSITIDVGNIMIECGVMPPLPTVTTIDNCDDNPTVTLREDKEETICMGDTMLTRTWIVMDACGNMDSVKQEVLISDNTSPVFFNAPGDTTVQCIDAIPPFMDPQVDDNCGSMMPSIVRSESRDAGDCPGDSIITRMWTTTDNCGNASMVSQVIRVIDTIKPVITCPADIILTGCTLADAPMPDTLTVTASDGCSMVSISHQGDTDIGSGCIGDTLVISRVYRATDQCGNFSECTQLIKIVDDQAPMITCPSEVLVVGCTTSDVPDIDINSVTSTDNCTASPMITHVSDVPMGTPCPGDTIKVTRTYRATDACGNTSDCTQLIKIVDNVDPVITFCPPDMTVSCVADIPSEMSSEVVATDNCTVPVTATLIDEVDNTGTGCSAAPLTKTYTYEVTDACGNSTTCQQVITVIDDTDPVITSCPMDMTVKCIADIPAAEPMAVIASDNCGVVNDATLLSSVDNMGSGCSADPLTRTYTYQVTDPCGNATTCTQVITVINDIAPTITSCPEDGTAQCISEIPPAAPEDVVANDHCGADVNVTTINTENTGTGCSADPYRRTYTYEAVDACGNATTCTQTYTVIDDTPPTITNCPADMTVQCIEDIPAADESAVTAIDNCGVTNPATLTSTVNDGAGCPSNPYTSTYTYEVRDACGNATTCTQVITVIDDTDPIIVSRPTDMTVKCISEIPDPTPLDVVVSDNCAMTNPVMVIDTSDNGGSGCAADPYVLTYTYQVTDACDNATTAVQSITVIDDEAPVITSCPPDIQVSCISEIPASDEMSVVATDNCGVINGATLLSTTDNDGTGCSTSPFTRTYTYQVTDACGNAIACQQVITVIDETVPVITSCPANLTVDCIEDVPDPDAGSVTGTDNCGVLLDAELMMTTDNGGSGCMASPLIFTYTYELSDPCGNTTTCQQNITVIDDVAPVITSCPADITVKCMADIPSEAKEDVVATDNCIETQAATLLSTTDNGGSGCAADPFILTYTYEVRDLCGNTTTCQQRITVIDDIAPVITSCPADMTVSCIEEIPAPDSMSVAGTDNCGVVNDATLLNTSNNGGAGCSSDPYILTYTFQLTDDCGNSVTCQQVITVIDDINPVITNCTAGATLQCASQIPGPDPSQVMATDNCLEVNMARHIDTEESGTGCSSDPLIKTYIYEITDLCGNATTCRQTFRVIDDIPPVINSCPAGATLQCIDDIPTATPLAVVATDNCGTTQDPTLISTDDNGGAGCSGSPYILTYTYEVRDLCGNATTCTQTFTVMDDTAPTITSCPADGQVSCISEIPPADSTAVVAMDNCGVTMPARLIDTQDQGTGCAADPYSRSYTYEVRDACGNATTCTHTYTVIDDIDPVITDGPADLIVACIDDIPDPNTAAIAGTDNCGILQSADTIGMQHNGGSGCTNDPYIFTYTYELQDACGNADTFIQTITVVDTTPPTISCPQDQLIIGCSIDDIPDPDISQVTFEDNCINASVEHINDDITGGGCMGDTLVVTRTYRVADACGTEITCTQTFKLIDNIDPIITNVSDTTIDCDQDYVAHFTNWVANNGGGTASDNCGPITWTTIPPTPLISDISAPTCITFVATDPCGNQDQMEACFYIHCSEIDKTLVQNLDQDGSGDIGGGDSLEYQVIYTNTGSTTLTGVQVTDDLINPAAITCPSVAPGETCTLVGYYEVTDIDITNGSIDNTGNGSSDQRDDLSDIYAVSLGMPSMAIEKQIPQSSNDADESMDLSAGDEITYTISVTNNGTANLTNVTISDPLIDPETRTCPLLMPGEVCTLTGTYIITPDDVATGSISNTATAESDQTEPLTDDVKIDLPQPDMTIKKGQPTNSDGDGSGDISEGDTLTYTVIVTNSGEANLTDVTIIDNTITQIGGDSPCSILLSGESCTLIGIYVITGDDVSGTDINQITNTASATSDQTGPVTDDTTIEVPNPSMDLKKSAAELTGDTDGSGDISLGDTLTYTVILTNNGNANITDVNITDPELEPSTQYCPTVNMGESCILIGYHVVNADDIQNGRLQNIATATSVQPPLIENDTSSVIIPQPAHTMSKSSPTLAMDVDQSGDVSEGDIMSYTITFTNVGTSNLTNVTVTDNLISPSMVTCPLVRPQETCVLQGSYTVTSDDLGTTLSNVATTDTDQTDEQTDVADIIVPFPQMEIHKSDAVLLEDNDGDGLITTNDIVQYTITVSNTGTANLTNVVISDDLINPSTTTCPLLTPREVCTLVGTYTITQDDMNAAMIMNQATAISDQTDQVEDKVITDLPYRPELTFDKSITSISLSEGVNDDQIDAQDIITYQYLVTNTGLQTMTDIQVIDDGPTFNGIMGTNLLSPLSCPLDVLQPGESMTCTATYVISQDDFDNAVGRPNGVRNTADVSATEPNGDNYSPERDDAIGEIPETPSIELLKVATDIMDTNGDGIQWAGDHIDYTFTVTNTGNTRIDEIVIDDDRIIEPIVCGMTSLEPNESTTCTARYEVTLEDAESGMIINTATVFGITQTGVDISDVSDDPADQTTTTSDPTVVVVPCPSIGCPAEFNLSLSATEPFEIIASTLGLPTGFIITITDENGDPIPGNIIDCSFAGFNLTYTAQHPCRPSSCWGKVLIETKGTPELITHRDTIYCGMEPDLPTLAEVIDATHDGGCYAPLQNITEQTEVIGDACDGQYQVRTVMAQSVVDNVKTDIILRRDTTEYQILDLDSVLCPKSNDFEESLNFVCRQTQKFPDMSPSNVFIMTQRSFARTYPHIDTRQLTETFDTTIVIDSIVEVVIDTTLYVDGLWVSTEYVRKDTFSRQRILRDFRKVLIPLVEGQTCNFSVKYTDVVYPGCLGDTTSILRTWQILDWCNGKVKDCEQWIRIFDDTPPDVAEIPDDEVDIDPWTCEATYELPELEIKEDCTTAKYTWSTDAGQIDASSGVITGIQQHMSPVTITATVIDDCGNVRERSFSLTLVDHTAPIALAHDELTVSLTVDPVQQIGVAKVYADDINNDSHDGSCGEVTYCVLLDEELNHPIIRNGTHLTTVEGAPLYHPVGCHIDGIYEYTVIIDKQEVTEQIPYVICKDFVKFCCDDIGTHKVALIVSDGSPASQDAITWTNIAIEDKSSPVASCKDHYVNCGDDISPELLGYPQVQSAICSEGDLTYIDSSDIDNCGSGQITRVWSLGDEVMCTEIIHVSADVSFDPYTIKWPKHYTGDTYQGVRRECQDWEGESRIVEYTDDVSMGSSLTCNTSLELDSPKWCSSGCGLVGANSELIEVETDASCKKIIRRWTIIDWCTWEENTDIDDDSVTDQVQAVDDEWLDVDHSEEAGRWLSAYTSRGESAQYNGDGALVTDLACTICEKSEAAADHVYFRYTSVDVDGYYTYDQVIKVDDQTAPIIELASTHEVLILSGAQSKTDTYEACKGSTQLSALARDLCNEALQENARISWTVYVIDEDGQLIISPLSLHGDTATIDLPETAAGITYTVVWNAKDGCGNSTTERSTVTFVDRKAPTPICLQDISTTAMQTNGSTTIWAQEYDRGSFDNCSEVEVLFRDEDGVLTTAIDFDCTDMPNGRTMQITTYMYVRDQAGNIDSCQVSIRIDDNGDACPDDGSEAAANISGYTMTEGGRTISGVEVSLSSPNTTTVSADNGRYAFANLPMYDNYHVSAYKNDDTGAGITVTDVLLIQRHILGQKLFTSPYEYVAADVNNDRRISVLDMVELRRVILGDIDQFARNTSWRFLDPQQTFNDPKSPWPFVETLEVPFLTADMSEINFMGVKVGDVNGSIDPAATNRQPLLASILLTDRLYQKGELVDIAMFVPDEVSAISALSYTMSHVGLRYIGAISAEMQISADLLRVEEARLAYVGLAAESPAENRLFVLRFEALKNGQLSKSLDLNGTIVASTAIDPRGQEYDLELDFIDDHIVSKEIKLYQNEPNPFESLTTIEYYLPDRAEVELNFYDVSGQLIHQVRRTDHAGHQSVQIEAKDLRISGIIHYQLKVGDQTYSKKMIKVE